MAFLRSASKELQSPLHITDTFPGAFQKQVKVEIAIRDDVMFEGDSTSDDFRQSKSLSNLEEIKYMGHEEEDSSDENNTDSETEEESMYRCYKYYRMAAFDWYRHHKKVLGEKKEEIGKLNQKLNHVSSSDSYGSNICNSCVKEVSYFDFENDKDFDTNIEKLTEAYKYFKSRGLEIQSHHAQFLKEINKEIYELKEKLEPKSEKESKVPGQTKENETNSKRKICQNLKYSEDSIVYQSTKGRLEAIKKKSETNNKGRYPSKSESTKKNKSFDFEEINRWLSNTPRETYSNKRMPTFDIKDIMEFAKSYKNSEVLLSSETKNSSRFQFAKSYKNSEVLLSSETKNSSSFHRAVRQEILDRV